MIDINNKSEQPDMKIDEVTQLITETLTSLMTIADEDPKQNSYTSSIDVVEMLMLMKSVLKDNLIRLPHNTFKSDPFLSRHFEYTNKECVDAIHSTFKHASLKHPFSVHTLFKSRILPAILQTFRKAQTVEFIDIYFDYLVSSSLENTCSLQEAYAQIIKTSRLQTINNRLITIQKAAANVTGNSSSIS